MKILLIFTLYLISDPCCLGSETVSGYLGETVTISCSYPEQFERNTKFFFKQNHQYFTEKIRNSETQRDRFSIYDDRSSNVLSVKIRDVREDDGGVYFCGVNDGGQQLLLPLLRDSATAPGSSDIIIIIIVCVCVALLLIGGSALIYYKLRFTKSQGSTPSSRMELEEQGPTYTTISFQKNPDSPTVAAVPYSEEECATEYSSVKHHT
ncbi:CMRF35-like molecule 5 [Pygocentrus nattereri]|uniref:CMRF35-like molecule 5 n=1 Tax=Pygocentrus nattereri TaxID=42514 RepID=UPI0018914513|nr:CMRF35-like molecule 5 [Pygocentrus nattereri]